jgi:hypothetical protein
MEMASMKRKTLELLFREVFGFLLDEFNFRIILSKSDNFGYYMTVLNPTTGIELEYEIRECFVNIVLYKLIDQKLVKRTNSAIIDGTPITGFSFDWILALRNPEVEILPTYKYEEYSIFHDKEIGFKAYLSMIAQKLKEYASDILKGDFSIFPELDVMVKEHWKDYYIEKYRKWNGRNY